MQLDDHPEDYCDEPRRRRRSGGCRCFGPGEVGGTCPGPDRCPIQDEGHEDEDDDEGATCR